MVIKFLKRVWLSYVVCLGVFSAAVAGVFTITSEGQGILGFISLMMGTLLVAVPVTLLIVVSVVFWAWSIQQRRRIFISRCSASLIGLLAGTFLHILVILIPGSWANFPNIITFAFLCGGSCGLMFNLIFACLGGFKLTNLAEQVAASDC